MLNKPGWFSAWFSFTITYHPRSQNVKTDALAEHFFASEIPEKPETLLPPSCIVGALTWEIESLVRSAQQMEPDSRDGPPTKLYVLLLWGLKWFTECRQISLSSQDQTIAFFYVLVVKNTLFVTGLLPSRDIATKLTIVDSFSKVETTQLVIDYLFRLHGIPVIVILDQGENSFGCVLERRKKPVKAACLPFSSTDSTHDILIKHITTVLCVCVWLPTTRHKYKPLVVFWKLVFSSTRHPTSSGVFGPSCNHATPRLTLTSKGLSSSWWRHLKPPQLEGSYYINIAQVS